MHFRFHLDRSLPISVSVQLRGQIEYGIACGEIARGSRLPSVRELANELKIAPATVSQVYKELLQGGLLETVPGRGTFVTDTPRPAARDYAALHAAVGELVQRARTLGFEPHELAQVLHLELGRKSSPTRPIRLLFVGIFSEATQAYAGALQKLLQPGTLVEAVTLDDLERTKTRQEAMADLIVTLAHREGAVKHLLGGARAITSVHFIPSEATRTALAALSPDVRLGIVATFEDFLPTMKAGVTRHAPHVYETRACALGSPELGQLLSWSSVVVYATGAGGLTELLPVNTPAFEYRHTPDPRSVETTLLPLIADLRKRRARENQRDELAPS